MDKYKAIDKTIWAIIGIGAVSYGAMFLYVYKATRQITFAVDGVSVENFNKKGITLGVYINANNAGNRTLVIDDVVKSSGRIPNREEIIGWLQGS